MTDTTKTEALRLAKSETVALWHAVNWMAECLKSAHPEDMAAAWQIEAERLKIAKQALRKVNAIRKAQAVHHGTKPHMTAATELRYARDAALLASAFSTPSQGGKE